MTIKEEISAKVGEEFSVTLECGDGCNWQLASADISPLTVINQFQVPAPVQVDPFVTEPDGTTHGTGENFDGDLIRCTWTFTSAQPSAVSVVFELSAQGSLPDLSGQTAQYDISITD